MTEYQQMQVEFTQLLLELGSPATLTHYLEDGSTKNYPTSIQLASATKEDIQLGFCYETDSLAFIPNIQGLDLSPRDSFKFKQAKTTYMVEKVWDYTTDDFITMAYKAVVRQIA
jgi:hypothetical protein